MYLKKAPIRTPNKSSAQHGIRDNRPLRASLDQCPSAATMRPPLGGQRKPQRPCRRASASAPPHGWAAYAKHTPSCPWFRSTHGWTAQARLQQVVDKADAIVLEHHAIAFLGCVEIDIGANGKIMVAIGVAKGLLHMPHVLRFLIGFIDSQKRH